MLSARRLSVTQFGILSYLDKYGFSLFIIIPFWTIASVISPFSSYIIVPLTLIFLYYRGMQEHLVILLMTSLVLGDSREFIFKGYEVVRYAAVSTLSFLTIMDFLYRKYEVNLLFMWLLPFTLSALVSLIDSPVGARGFSKTIGIFLIYFVGLNFIRHYLIVRGKVFVVELIQFAHFVLGIGIILIFIAPDIAFWGGKYRYKGVFGNPNGVGAFATFTYMFCSIVFPYLENQIDKRFKTWTWGLIFTSIFLSGSRNSLGVVVVFYLLRESFKGNYVRRIFILAGILPLFIIFSRLITVADFAHFFGLESFFRLESLSNASGRLYAWQFAWTEFSKHPWLGMGYTYDDILFADYIPDEVIKSGHLGGVHNSYLVFLVNTGVVGIFLFFVFYLRLMFTIRTAKNLWPFLLAVLFSSTFESWLSAALNYLNTYFVIIYVVSRLAEDEWEPRQIVRDEKKYKLPPMRIRAV